MPESFIDALQDIARTLVGMTAGVLAGIESQLGVQLTFTQYRTLILLNEADRHPSELAEVLGVTRPAITKLIRSLIARGFVVRNIEAADRRMARLRLTGRGTDLVEQVRRERARRFGAVSQGLTEAEMKRLSEALEHLKTILEKAAVDARPGEIGPASVRSGNRI